MADFDPSKIEVNLENLGFEDDISPKEVRKRNNFGVKIANNSDCNLKWLAFEVVTEFVESKSSQVYSSIIVNGTTQGSSSKVITDTTDWYKNKFVLDQRKYKGGTWEHNLWISWPEHRDLSDYIGIYIYRIYGETFEGVKFQQLRHSQIDFDAYGHAHAIKSRSGGSSGCFVTTAAFGNAHHPTVESFRGLRD